MDEGQKAVTLEVKSIKRMLRILASGFVLNGVAAIVGLAKMGVVSHSIDSRLIPTYFTCLAIWGWYAVNGESVRQSTRQQELEFSWKVGLSSFKYEWKLLIPFTIAILVISEFTNVLRDKIRLQDVLITVLCGWLFVYTSTSTGILESRGRIELSNWITLGTSLISLPFFIYLASKASFSILLTVYFLLNLFNGLLHGLILSQRKEFRRIPRTRVNENPDTGEFKKVLLLESLPRVAAPLLLAFFSVGSELTLYSVLSRIFLIYGIYAISITPIVSLKGRKFSPTSIDRVLGIIGPIIFVMATFVVVLYSGELIALVSSTIIDLSFLDLLSFALLGALSISTQPFIASICSGLGLRMRSKSAFVAVLAGLVYLPVLVNFFGSSGAFFSLSIHQITYYALLKRYSKHNSFYNSN